MGSIVEQLEKTYTKFSQKSHEVAEFYTNIIFGFSSCLTIIPKSKIQRILSKCFVAVSLI